VQRDPRLWPEPERYRPERFTPEQNASRPRFAYFPFGGGPRLCIGNAFALLEAQVVLSKVASRYKLELADAPSQASGLAGPDGATVEVEPGVTLRPKHGLWMRIRARA
jgi:cytochrome P450